MVFLCGRPGCGRESSATLQIDAPASTVTLVDPRVSRDGIPLCPHHADATTPPLGWTMNDLRSQNRAPLAPVHPLGPRTGEIAPGQARPRSGNPLFGDSRAVDRDQPESARPRGRRNRPAEIEPADAVRPRRDSRAEPEQPEIRRESLMDARSDAEPRPRPAPTSPRMGGLSFPVSQEMTGAPVRRTGPDSDLDLTDDDDDDGDDFGDIVVEVVPARPSGATPPAARTAAPSAARSGAGAGSGSTAGSERRGRSGDFPAGQAPATRPSKRRDAAEEDEPVEDEHDEDEKFPWHFSFKNDEPQELQAKTPLLARAFRSSVG